MAFQPGEDIFNMISEDPPAMAEADRMFYFVKRRLGDDIINVELTEQEIYSSFEYSILEFGRIINEYQGKSNLSDILGTATGTLSGLENRYIIPNLSYEIMLAEQYGEELGVGGYDKTYMGSIQLIGGQQSYDLRASLSQSFYENYGRMPQKIRVLELYWVDPANQFATYDAANYIYNNLFQYGTSVPGTQYNVMPLFESVLRRETFKEAVKIRLSHYSYNIVGGDLILYPVPHRQQTLWMRYKEAIDPVPIGQQYFTGTNGVPYQSQMAKSISGVSNIANAPYGVIPWSRLNSIAQQWIRSFTFAVCKETLGYTRRKINSGYPVAGDATLTLDGDLMVTEGITEQQRLIEELRKTLDELTYEKLSEQNAQEAEFLNKKLSFVPNLIYVG